MSCRIDRIARLSIVVSTALGLVLGACDGSGTIDGMDGGSPAPELREVIVEVSYEPNAEPYTGSVPLGGDTWGLFESNMVALFEGTGITVSSPSRLEQMTEMEDLPDTDFDVDRILALDEAYRRTGASPGRRVFHALWLDGYFSDGERQSGVIGVSIGNTGVIAIFARALILGSPVTIFGDGGQTRDFTYIDNVVQANLRAMDAEPGSLPPGVVMNVGVGERVSLNQLYDAMAELAGVDERPAYAETRAGDVRHSLASLERIREGLGYEPSVGFAEGIERTFRWYRESLGQNGLG